MGKREEVAKQRKTNDSNTYKREGKDRKKA